MSKQSGRVLNLDTSPHALCACMLLVAEMWDPGPSTSPHKPQERFRPRDHLLRQARFAHFSEEDIEFFQRKVDEMWDRWLVPGVIPLDKELEVTNENFARVAKKPYRSLSLALQFTKWPD